MKKKVVAALIGVMIISITSGLGYASGCNLTSKKYEKKIETLEKTKEEIEQLETEISELKSKEDSTADEADKEESKKAEKKKEKNKEKDKEAEDTGYQYIGFEDIFGAVCTKAQLESIKEEVVKGIADTEYAGVKKISMSEYTRMDADKGKLQGYARLDDKGVLEVNYSIRYGKPSVKVSEYTQDELTELEKYGRVMDVDSTETVAPRPIETETPKPTDTPEPTAEPEEEEPEEILDEQEEELVEDEVYEVPLS